MTRATLSNTVRGGVALAAAAAVVVMAGCPSMAPLAVKWGGDLISAASQNYSQQYSKQLEGLLLAVYTDQATKKLQSARRPSGQPGFNPKTAGAQGQGYPGDQGMGQQAPYGSSPGYPAQSPYGGAPVAQGDYGAPPPQPDYGDQTGAYPPGPMASQQPAYGGYPGSQPVPQGYPGAQQPAPYPQEQGAYPPVGEQQPYGGAYPGAQPDPYATQPGGAPQGTYGAAPGQYPAPGGVPQGTYGAAPGQYPAPGGQPGYGAAPAIVLDATILAQRAADRASRRSDPVPLQDGEVLRDGGNDPRKGDVMKFSFRANCNCYVYVIGVDATGYVARIFPDPASPQGNPVRANEQYVVPGGTAWYGLDQYKGTEQVFFIASRAPRQDIENTLTQLAQTDRSSVARNYRPVRVAALPDPASRGLVRVQMSAPNTVRAQSGQQFTFDSQAFAAPAGADDIVITRWFKHE